MFYVSENVKKSPRTIAKWISEGLLPAARDTKGRRWTTKGIIEKLAIQVYKAELEIKRAKK